MPLLESDLRYETGPGSLQRLKQVSQLKYGTNWEVMVRERLLTGPPADSSQSLLLHTEVGPEEIAVVLRIHDWLASW